MTAISRKVINAWCTLGPRFLPFADVASADLPLGRLLRLSLFQISVGMVLVLLVGTLNRVMIVELSVPSTLVGVMLALPLLFAPFRALVGFRSDNHRCALGWRRVPFIWNGTLMVFAGLSIMPFALLVLAGKGNAADLPGWIGQLAAAIAFLLAGSGVHVVQTAGLALATDLTAQRSHARVVGLMYVALLVGMLVSALIFGIVLQDFSPGRLIQVIQAGALISVVLNVIAIWKQESRRSWQAVNAEPAPDVSFTESLMAFCDARHARRRLVVVGLGTLAFGMAELILEPFGGQVLALSVSATTKLTALLAFGGLLGFGYASRVLSKGYDPYRIARDGACIGLPAFVLVIASAPLDLPILFLVGNLLIGFGAALFGHGTLTATMNSAPADKAGLALGAWGAVQATAAGLGIAASGLLRDIVNRTVDAGAAPGYYTVYGLEIVLLIITIYAAWPLLKALPGKLQPSRGHR
jgi:BCD family chlorophyll transporter-like MFS transporter